MAVILFSIASCSNFFTFKSFSIPFFTFINHFSDTISPVVSSMPDWNDFSLQFVILSCQIFYILFQILQFLVNSLSSLNFIIDFIILTYKFTIQIADLTSSLSSSFIITFSALSVLSASFRNSSFMLFPEVFSEFTMLITELVFEAFFNCFS